MLANGHPNKAFLSLILVLISLASPGHLQNGSPKVPRGLRKRLHSPRTQVFAEATSPAQGSFERRGWTLRRHRRRDQAAYHQRPAFHQAEAAEEAEDADGAEAGDGAEAVILAAAETTTTTTTATRALAAPEVAAQIQEGGIPRRIQSRARAIRHRGTRGTGPITTSRRGVGSNSTRSL